MMVTATTKLYVSKSVFVPIFTYGQNFKKVLSKYSWQRWDFHEKFTACLCVTCTQLWTSQNHECRAMVPKLSIRIPFIHFVQCECNPPTFGKLTNEQKTSIFNAYLRKVY